MRIDVLYFDGCPHFETTLLLVRDVASELGIDANIEAVPVRDPERARELRFLGSPTVRIDGADIELSAQRRTEAAFGCRIYGGSGVPPRALVQRAIERARAA